MQFVESLPTQTAGAGWQLVVSKKIRLRGELALADERQLSTASTLERNSFKRMFSQEKFYTLSVDPVAMTAIIKLKKCKFVYQ